MTVRLNNVTKRYGSEFAVERCKPCVRTGKNLWIARTEWKWKIDNPKDDHWPCLS